MSNEIISYREMCDREDMNLQRGMNFQKGDFYSIILMSVKKNSPYEDRIEDEGSTLIYEGHDIPRNLTNSSPKLVDQVSSSAKGRVTENGKFYNATQEYKKGMREAELIKVYEKVFNNIWSYNGFFKLIDSWVENDGIRNVFKFKMVAIDDEFDYKNELRTDKKPVQHRRIIPAKVKQEVWKRDHGRCVDCGATEELHFDHIIPYSKGGTSIMAENIQLLCARCNLEKRDRII
jgi:hypothetical protein